MQKVQSITRVKNIDVFRLMPEGIRIELIDNTLYMPPSPFSNHQSVSMSFSINIFKVKQQQLGIVFTAPFDVYFDNVANAV